MAIDAEGNWNGVCACGKMKADGVACFLGATHQPAMNTTFANMPWEKPFFLAPAVDVAEPLPKSLPWSVDLFPWSGVTATEK